MKGLAATRPGKGERVDVSSGRAQRYQDYLEREHANAAARVGAKPPSTMRSASTASLRLDARPGADAGGSPRCSVGDQGSTTRLTDDKKPVDFMKLTGSHSVWAANGGKQSAGRGVVVGIVDSGTGRKASRSPARCWERLGLRRRILTGRTGQARTRS